MNMKNLRTFDEFVNESKKDILNEKNVKARYFIAKGKYDNFKKGEIVASSGKSYTATFQGDDGPFKSEVIYIELADPGYEEYTEMDADDFPRFFKEVDPQKDTVAMKQLSKWGLVEFGTIYYVGDYFLSKGDTPKDGAATAIQNAKKVSAESPKLAVKKKEGYPAKGKLVDLIRNKVWGVKQWSNMFNVVFADGEKEKIGAQKLANLLKKSGMIK